MNCMCKLLSVFALSTVCVNAVAHCITGKERKNLKAEATTLGTVKLFVSHADLPLGTSVQAIQAATADRVAALNSQAIVVYLTESWVPAAAPGFEAFVTADGVELLFQEGYCFGKIE